MCGATDLMKTDAMQEASFAGIMRQQAADIFGKTSGIFNDIVNALSPIAAAGPGQEGFTPAQMAQAKSQAMTENAQVSRASAQSAREAVAAQGGGNMALPSGVAVGTEMGLANASAQRESTALSNIEAQSRELGLKKWQFAEEGLGKTPEMFGTSNQAGAIGAEAGKNASGAASEVAQADMSPWNAAIGALGGVAGQAVHGLVPGGGG